MKSCLPLIAILAIASATNAQIIRKINYGWGDAARLGRWNPVFVTVEDSQARSIKLQIHGTYGEKSEALCVEQTAVANVIPTTYLLLFPLNTQPSRIEVIVTDEKTGRMLGSQPLQNPESFSPAGNVPMKLLSTDEILVGISGDIGDALALQTQLDRAGVTAGILNEIKLPANFAGYDGISVLILAAADLPALTPDQEQAILEWIRCGGNLVLIPGTTPLLARSALMQALPCEIGVNRMTALPGGSAATQPSILNGRELSPRPGAEKFSVLNQDAYQCRLGLGKLAVLPVNIAPLQFAEDSDVNAFWKQLLSGMVKVPTARQPTEEPVGEEEDMPSIGPDAADSVGRGPRESVAIRHTLELLGAAESGHSHDWQSLLLYLAGIFALVGPVDSIILMRLGLQPRNWLTIIGWVGLLATLGTYAIARQPPDANATIKTFRLVDQVNDKLIAATDILAVKSDHPTHVPLSLDETEWWEPANQAARSLSPDRFVDAICHEDRKGCRPESIDLIANDPQSWHGESAGGDPGLLRAVLALSNDKAGNSHLVGKLINASDTPMTDIQIATASGNFLIDQSLPAGASMDVDELVTDKPIALSGLPDDVTDVAPERADRIGDFVKSGWACVYCEMSQTTGNWRVLRATVELGK